MRQPIGEFGRQHLGANQVSHFESASIEFDGKNGHADAEDDSGKGAFSPALAEGEREAAHHDGNQREALGDGARERLLQNVYRVFPRGVAGLLRVGEASERKRQGGNGGRLPYHGLAEKSGGWVCSIHSGFLYVGLASAADFAAQLASANLFEKHAGRPILRWTEVIDASYDSAGGRLQQNCSGFAFDFASDLMTRMIGRCSPRDAGRNKNLCVGRPCLDACW